MNALISQMVRGNNLCDFCDILIVTADFTILLNQTTYNIAVDHSLALTGIPLVRFTVFISEAVTSESLTNGWTSTISSTIGLPTNFFTFMGNTVQHSFPASFTPHIPFTIALSASRRISAI